MSNSRKFRTRHARPGITLTRLGGVCYRSVFDGICYETVNKKSPEDRRDDIMDAMFQVETEQKRLRNPEFVLRCLEVQLAKMELLSELSAMGSDRRKKKAT